MVLAAGKKLRPRQAVRVYPQRLSDYELIDRAVALILQKREPKLPLSFVIV
jgi:hypothetical protein